MPEGDTIFRAARTLHRALAGRRVTRFRTLLPTLARVVDDAPLPGRTVERVLARGKNLLIEFSGDLILRTHMRMNGSWHIYRHGEPWRRRADDVRIVIETEEFVAVAFCPPIAEFHTRKSLESANELRDVGPDLLGESFDRETALGKLRERDDREIADALLDQRALAGIGNVFKSEILFVCGVDPFARVRELDEAVLRKLLEASERLLRANVADQVADGAVSNRGVRRTTGRLDPGAALWVYGRRGRPCRRCGEPIEMRKQGPNARVTFWCSRCQPRGR